MKLTNLDDKKAFVGKVFVLLSDSLTCTDIWGYYLVNEKTEPEKHLRILAATIWFCSLYDSIDARDRVLSQYMDIAQENELLNTVKWCGEADSLFSHISDLLSSFSIEEQVYIQKTRDILVHGWLHSRTCEEQYIKYVEDGVYAKKKVANKEITRMTLPYLSTGWAVSIGKMTPRFLDQDIKLWKKINELFVRRRIFHREIYEDIGIVI